MTTEDVLALICRISHTRRAVHIALHVGGEAQSSSAAMERAEHLRGREGEEGEGSQDATAQDPAGGRAAWGQSWHEEEEKPLPRRKSQCLPQAEFNPVPRHTVTEESLIRRDNVIIQHRRSSSRLLPKTAFVTLLKCFMLSFVFKVFSKLRCTLVFPSPVFHSF